MKKTKYAKGGRTIGGMSARLEYLTDAIGSDELYDKFRSKTGITSNNLKDIDAVAFAYSDYGGDFFDRVVVAYFVKNYPDNIVWENSAYNGRNAIVFGDVAKEYMEATEGYILGFENLEDEYHESRWYAEGKMIEDIVDNLKQDEWIFDEQDVVSYLHENFIGRYNILSSGEVDYSERDIVDELFNEGLIDKENFAKGGSMKDAEEESYSGLEKKAFWAGGNQGMKASMGKDYMTFEEWAEQNKIKPTKELRSAFIEGGKKAFGMARGNYAKGGNMNTWTVKSHSGASGKYCLYNSSTGKSMGKFNSKESAVRFAKNMGSKAYAKGGLMGKLKSSASKIGKSVKSGYSKGKQYAKDKLHQKKKDIALDVIYETKENLAEGRDERMATEKAYNVVDKRYAKGGRVSVGNKVKIKDSGKTMRVNKISKNSDGYIEFSGSQGSYLKGDIDKMAKGGGVGKKITINNVEWANDDNKQLGIWLLTSVDGSAILSKSPNANELEKNIMAYYDRRGSIAKMVWDDDADDGLSWVTFGDLFVEVNSVGKHKMAKGGGVGDWKIKKQWENAVIIELPYNVYDITWTDDDKLELMRDVNKKLKKDYDWWGFNVSYGKTSVVMGKREYSKGGSVPNMDSKVVIVDNIGEYEGYVAGTVLTVVGYDDSGYLNLEDSNGNDYFVDSRDVKVKKSGDGSFEREIKRETAKARQNIREMQKQIKKPKGYYAKGGTTKTSNSNARQYVEAMQPFEGSNLEGKMINGCYVVLSYGYYPIFVYKDGNWYENSNKYSNTTAKQMSRVRPYEDVNVIIKKTTEELKKLYNKYARGGKMAKGGMTSGYSYSIGGL